MRTFPKWSAHNVKEWASILVATPTGEPQVNPVSAAIINYTMVVGLSEITAENADEVFMRFALLEAVRGAVLTLDDRPLFITYEDVQRHVGLRTEAPEKTLAEFWRDLQIGSIPIGTGHLEANGGLPALAAFWGP
jgi:hypothetical protein